MSKLFIKIILIIIIVPVVAYYSTLYYYRSIMNSKEAIKIGILHSMTGSLATSEMPIIDAMLLAVEEINSNGGILGRYIEPVIVDGASDADTFEKMARVLIKEDHVVAIFGCWLSSARKSVKTVVEQYNNLLFFPLTTEGLELSPNIIYMGATANQIFLPVVEWALRTIGDRVFLVGGDGLFSRAVSALVRKKVLLFGGQIVGEEHIEIGSDEVDHAIQAIVKTKPSFIVNSIDGSSNIPFYKALRKAGIKPDTIPTLALSIGEQEVQDMGAELLEGEYSVWSYFQTLDNLENYEFIKRFKNKYGAKRVVTNQMENGYSAIYMWAQAVQEAGATNPEKVRMTIKRQRFDSPEGRIYVDFDTQYTWKIGRAGKIKSDGTIDVVWDTKEPIMPQPYPIYETKEAWEKLLDSWYKEWGNKWIS